MSATSTRVPPGPTGEHVFPLSVEQYHTMIETGVLASDDPVELLEGVLVVKMSKNPSHCYVTQVAQDEIRPMLPTGWSYRAQEPVTLGDGEPEPDGAIAQGTPRDYLLRHPCPADTALVIEVAESTLARDRGIKLRSYARARIPVYWIVNLVERQVEAYTEPDGETLEPAYRKIEVFRAADSIPVVIGGAPIGFVPVARLLPPVSASPAV